MKTNKVYCSVKEFDFFPILWFLVGVNCDRVGESACFQRIHYYTHSKAQEMTIYSAVLSFFRSTDHFRRIARYTDYNLQCSNEDHSCFH